MAEHDDESELPVPVREVIISWAGLLSERHGLDAGCVTGILQRTARDHNGNRLVGRLDAQVPPSSVPFAPSLSEALHYLPAEQALRLFEQEDLDQLAERQQLTAFLVDRDTPLYTLAELAELTADFIAHLERNSEPLLATGRPRTRFFRSRGLDLQLTNLYPVKEPTRVSMHRERPGWDMV